MEEKKWRGTRREGNGDVKGVEGKRRRKRKGGGGRVGRERQDKE